MPRNEGKAMNEEQLLCELKDIIDRLNRLKEDYVANKNFYGAAAIVKAIKIVRDGQRTKTAFPRGISVVE